MKKLFFKSRRLLQFQLSIFNVCSKNKSQFRFSHRYESSFFLEFAEIHQIELHARDIDNQVHSIPSSGLEKAFDKEN